MTDMAEGWLGWLLYFGQTMVNTLVIRRVRKRLWSCQCSGENSRIMESCVTFPRAALLYFGKGYPGVGPWPYLAFRKVYVPALLLRWLVLPTHSHNLSSSQQRKGICERKKRM